MDELHIQNLSNCCRHKYWSVNFTIFQIKNSFWRVFVIWPNSVVSTLTSNSCWYMFFFVLGSLTPLSLILLANSATGNRESIPRQYSSNVSNTNLYWFCKELGHFLAILGYILQFTTFYQFLARKKLIKSRETAMGNRESIPRQYSSNVSNTNLYWFCKELWHFLAILGYLLNMMLQFNNYLSSFGKQKLLKSCETGTFENRELIPRCYFNNVSNTNL